VINDIPLNQPNAAG